MASVQTWKLTLLINTGNRTKGELVGLLCLFFNAIVSRFNWQLNSFDDLDYDEFSISSVDSSDITDLDELDALE